MVDYRETNRTHRRDTPEPQDQEEMILWYMQRQWKSLADMLSGFNHLTLTRRAARSMQFTTATRGVQEPTVLFLDEPTSGLDSTSSLEVMGALNADVADWETRHAALSDGSKLVEIAFCSEWETMQSEFPRIRRQPGIKSESTRLRVSRRL